MDGGKGLITSKQRAALRSQSNGMETIFQIGKGGVSDTLVQQVNDALKAREMIKLRVLENAPVFAKEAAQQLAEQCGAEIVQVIGSRFILFKRNPQKPIYEM